MNRSKLYVVVVKVGNLPDGRAHCLRYRTDDLLKLVHFLDKQHQSWRWFNVYANRGNQKGEQVGSFTKYNRPQRKSI